jgi:hypothetical protein
MNDAAQCAALIAPYGTGMHATITSSTLQPKLILKDTPMSKLRSFFSITLPTSTAEKTIFCVGLGLGAVMSLLIAVLKFQKGDLFEGVVWSIGALSFALMSIMETRRYFFKAEKKSEPANE